MNQIEKSHLTGPARPENLSVDLTETPKNIIVVKQGGAGGGSCFLMLWLTGWTVGCVFLAGQFIVEPTLLNLAFALPFWTAWFAVAAYLIWLKFGKELFQARLDGASFERHAWIRLSAREIPLKEIIEFKECRSHHTENDRYLYGIEMQTLGKPLRFLFDLPENERKWLVHKLNSFYQFGDLAQEKTDSDSENSTNLTPLHEVLEFDNTLAKPPSSCRWSHANEFSALKFWRRGKISWGAFFGLLFINAFWNGIVLVFVLALFGFMPDNGNGAGLNGAGFWGLFVFLIPFEVIGLAMFFGFIYNLLEPLHSTSWTIDKHSISRTSSWPLLKFEKKWEIESLDRIELRVEDSEEKSNKLKLSGLASDSDDYELVLVDTENKDKCTIGELTEGEARWIGHQILKSRPSWF